MPVVQKFQTSELRDHRVAGRLIKIVYPEVNKIVLVTFVEIENFEKSIISTETV